MFREKKRLKKTNKKTKELQNRSGCSLSFSSLSLYGTLLNFLGMFHLHQKKWPGMQARKLWARLGPVVLGRNQRLSDVKRFLDVSLGESRFPRRRIKKEDISLGDLKVSMNFILYNFLAYIPFLLLLFCILMFFYI